MKTRIQFFLVFIFIFIGAITQAQNLLTNGDFESGAGSWSNTVGGAGVATFTLPVTGGGNVYAGVNAIRANVTTAGANAWDVQTIHGGFIAATGLAHSLTFWAKASVAGRQARIVIQNTTYAAQDVTLTTTWTQYTFNFTPTEASLQLKIHYFQTGDFFFDNFSIPDVSGGPTTVNATITPTTNYQQMIGFGGALTWYADRIFTGPNTAALCDLMFTDLGLDILRLKNWYYPVNYPTNKSTATMDPANFKTSFDITNQLHTLAKARNSNIDVLLCSWSPPKALKSNNLLPEGTLNKNAGVFMYKELAQYHADMLDNISFVPEYLSMQNEPGYVNPGWETCEWRPTETAAFPGYDKALDSLWERIKNRPNVPKIIGPETENLGAAAWNPALNTFRDMTNPVKLKPYLYGYAYHLYNYAGGAGSISPTNLNIVRDEFNNRPNFMTEFSSTNYNWIDVARMVHANLVEANTSAYIYWELVWDQASPSTMIGLTNAGAYTVKDNYYAIKHYAKYVDKGYTRIAISGNNATLNVTAFRNPAGNQITVVAINNHVSPQPLNIALAGASILSAQAYRSVAGNYWQSLGAVNLATTQSLPGKSLTTFVLSTSPLPVELVSFTGSREGKDALLKWTTVSEKNNAYFVLERSNDALHFDSIGTIKGQLESNETISYEYTDADISQQKQYYRLKQVDVNGAFTKSEQIELPALESSEFVSVVPNPFQDKLNVLLSGNTKISGSEISIYDAVGNQYCQMTTHESMLEIPTQQYPSGLYLVHVRTAGHSYSFKIVK